MSTLPLSSADTKSARPVRKREIFAWTLYDWANSSYSTLLITIVVVYLTNVVMPGTSGQLMYSYGIGVTMFVAALFSPVIGAIADARATKAVFFRWTTIPGCLAAAANAAPCGFAFRSKEMLFPLDGGKRPKSTYPPRVKITFTVVSTSTGSPLSR